MDTLCVRERSNTHLKAEPFDSAECFVDQEKFVDDSSGIANKQCTFRLKKRVEQTARNRRPAAFLADLREGPSVTRKECVLDHPLIADEQPHAL